MISVLPKVFLISSTEILNCLLIFSNSLAEQRVKTNLTLTAIAEAEKIEATDEDIDKELEKVLPKVFLISSTEILNCLLIFSNSLSISSSVASILLREQMKDDAEQRVKTNLTLTAIAEAEKIEATDEDIDKELEKMSKQFNISVEDFF
jgi:FKBP-type peptidyl-prolyl cis-trans isomerase (trigger factor)